MSSLCDPTDYTVHGILQARILMQGLNPGLPRCRRILHQLSHQESPASSKHTWNPDLTSGDYFLLYVFISLSQPSFKFTLLNSTFLHMKVSRGKENTDLWCSFLKTTCSDLLLLIFQVLNLFCFQMIIFWWILSWTLLKVGEILQGMSSIPSDARVTCFTAVDPAEGAQVSEHNFLCNSFDDPNE